MKFDKTIQVGKHTIGAGYPTFIIAEAGVNHGGDMAVAKQLIDMAAEAGADAVKFQAFRTEHLILTNVEKANYQQKTTAATESQYEMLKKLEVTQEQNLELKAYCEAKDIVFITTPFDEVSLDELDVLDLAAIKVASTDTTNLPFLKRIAAKGRPMFLSTGMTYLEEIRIALEEIAPLNQQIVLMQCTANYPIKDEEANLNVINTFKKNFDVLVGYSDHSVGIGAAPYAVPMGAVLVEKHFTLDKTLEGPDHRASLDPVELKAFVKQIRQIEKYMGIDKKIPTTSELKNRNSLQKCLVALRPIKKGEKIQADDIIAKRTGGVGLSPMYYKNVIGEIASKDYQPNDIIEL